MSHRADIWQALTGKRPPSAPDRSERPSDILNAGRLTGSRQPASPGVPSHHRRRGAVLRTFGKVRHEPRKPVSP